MPVVDTAHGLLLDIGGVVVRAPTELIPRLAEREPRLREVVERLAITTPRDELWQRLMKQEISERDYWAGLAAELGRALGEQWDTRAMMHRLYAGPAANWLNDAVISLMGDAKRAGLPVGALTNDLADFYSQEWIAAQDWLADFDTIIDASITGVMKPDPRAYAMAADALGLAPHRIVFLDDMPWNVEGARSASLQAIHVSHVDPSPAAAEARSRLSLSQ